MTEKGPHSGPILQIALSPTKNIVGTLSSDKTVKFWSFLSDRKLIFSYSFHQNEMAFDIHPLSLQCAIGYKEGLKIYFLLEEDLRVTYEYFSKPCTALSYSEGGQWLAVGYINQVVVMDSYSMVTVRTFSGHSAHIKDLIWLTCDKKLLTSCHNGNVNVWNMMTESLKSERKEEKTEAQGILKEVEHYNHDKKIKYLGIAYDWEFDRLVCCCSDSRVRCYSDKGVSLIMDYDTTPVVFHSVLISKKLKVICFGTSVGGVRVYLWPFTSFSKENLEYIDVAIHQGPTEVIKITYDFEFLVSGSADGSLVFSKIKEFINGEDISKVDFMVVLAKGQEMSQRATGAMIDEEADRKNLDLLRKISNTFNFAEFCLLSSNTQEQRRERIKELDFKIQNTKSDIEEKKEKIVQKWNTQTAKQEEENKAKLMVQKQ